jgi:tetratricopeptide (TPR) repeat protein
MRFLFFSSLLLLLHAFPGSAGTAKIDSLRQVINTASSDSTKIKALNALAMILKGTSSDEALKLALEAKELSWKAGYLKGEIAALCNIGILKYAYKKDLETSVADFEQAIALCKQTGDKKKEGSCLLNIGSIYQRKGEFPKAQDKFKQALALMVEVNDSSGMANTFINSGAAYLYQADYPRALEGFQKAETIYERIHDKVGIASTVTNIGSVYNTLKEYDKATEYYQRGAKLFSELGMKGKEATALSGVGVIYLHKNMLKEALACYQKALALQEETKDERGTAYAHLYIGDVSTKLKHYEEARKHIEESLELGEKQGDKHLIANDLLQLGEIEFNLKEYKQAENNLDRSFTLASEIGANEVVQNLYGNYADLYESTNRPAQALAAYRKFIALRDTASNQDRNSEMTRNQMQYEFDKQQAIEKLEQSKKDVAKEAELHRQKIIRNSFVAGFALLLVLAFVIYSALRQKNRANIEISRQKLIIEEKNKDITDSINYAKRIQDAVMPDQEIRDRIFPESFIFFQPRDIVSGDFFWFTEKNGQRLITAADCTGHGVPGAFMSMIGNVFLNEIVNEKGITDPGQILSELRYRVIRSLKQTGAEGEQKDGMDISLLNFAADGKSVAWAGANNPLWIIRDGECLEYHPDKRPIGFFKGKGLPFTTREIALQAGDMLYIFTDGYADQFGGPKQKKFKYKQLRALLLTLQDQPVYRQEEILAQQFDAWKGTLEQVDDVLLIGIRG